MSTTINKSSFLIPLNTGIGNAVLLTPLIKTIKKEIPNSVITLICDPEKGLDKLFRDDPNIDRIINDIDDYRYDVYFHTMLGSKKNWAFDVKRKNLRCEIVTQYYENHPQRFRERLFNTLLGSRFVSVNPKEHESLQYLSLFKSVKPDATVSLNIKEFPYSMELPSYYCVIQLGAAFNVPDTKNWPMEYWVNLINILSERMHVVLVGSKNEEKLGAALSIKNVINLIGKTELNELVGLIKKSQFFLGVDSGIGHISGALNHPTLILWGPTDFVKSHQVGSNTHFINLEKSCSPCRGPSQMGLWSGPESIRLCAYDQVCMKEITAEKVYGKLQVLKWV